MVHKLSISPYTLPLSISCILLGNYVIPESAWSQTKAQTLTDSSVISPLRFEKLSKSKIDHSTLLNPKFNTTPDSKTTALPSGNCNTIPLPKPDSDYLAWQNKLVAKYSPQLSPLPQQETEKNPCFELSIPLLPSENSVEFAQFTPTPEPPSLEPQPEIDPAPLPPPDQLIPPISPTPEGPDLPPSDVPGTITVERFEVRGSSVFSQAELEAITAAFTNRPLSFAELLQARSAVTQLYQDNGYINSGAFIPPQELDDGVVIIEVLEGGVEAINVTIDGRLSSDYVGSRLDIATKAPLNINKLVEALQLLRLDPLIDNISSELSASPRPGFSILDVTVTTAETFDLRAFFNNSRSPSVGSFRRGAGLTEANLFGIGDSISFDYSNTDGSDTFDVSYTIPINPRNGTIRLAYGTTASEVIEDPFDELDIDSESRYYELTYRQPLVQTPTREFVVGLTASRQESETSILGIPFPLSAGADDDGNTRISALRFFQEWLNRSESQVLAARSQFSFGLDLFDATSNEGEIPDSEFFSWRFQGQLVRLLAPDTLILLRSDLQLANDSLPPLEQFRIGGLDSVRGYRQDLLLTDNGFLVSAEARLPILRIPEWDTIMHFTPFIDYGQGWNFFGGNPDPRQLGAGGIGLRLQVSDKLTARLEWGIPWVDVNSTDRTLQEQGIYFSIITTPF